jgi:hypothetical protein
MGCTTSNDAFATADGRFVELKRMEGIPKLEDEAELEADTSKPSTSTVELLSILVSPTLGFSILVLQQWVSLL